MEPIYVEVRCENHDGQVDTASSYYVASVAPEVDYVVTLTELRDNADLYSYNDDATFQDVEQVSANPEKINEVLMIRARNTRLYLSIDGKNTQAGTSFRLNITNAERIFRDEGTRNDPVFVLVDTPYFGEVECESYYSVNVQENKTYRVQMEEHLDDADIAAYDSDDFLIPLAHSFNLGTEAERFVVDSTTDGLYLKVDGRYTALGTSYVLKVTEAESRNEGTSTDPLTLVVNRRHAGIVSTGDSHYSVDVVPNSVYRIEVSELNYDADLYVYHDADQSNLAGKSTYGAANSEVVVTFAESEELFIRVDGSLTEAGTEYSLIVKNDGPPRKSDGIVRIEPLKLTLGEIHHGQVNTNRSYYEVETIPGNLYEISISDLTDDADLYVYDNDATFTRIQDKSIVEGVGVDIVQVSASGPRLYIAVDGINYTFAGADYNLLVVEIPRETIVR